MWLVCMCRPLPELKTQLALPQNRKSFLLSGSLKPEACTIAALSSGGPAGPVTAPLRPAPASQAGSCSAPRRPSVGVSPGPSASRPLASPLPPKQPSSCSQNSFSEETAGTGPWAWAGLHRPRAPGRRGVARRPSGSSPEAPPLARAVPASPLGKAPSLPGGWPPRN